MVYEIQHSPAAPHSTASSKDFMLWAALLLISPLLSFFFALVVIFRSDGRNAEAFWALCIALALFLGMINATKLPESDLEQYYIYYEASAHQDLATLLIVHNRELLYYIVGWVFAHFLGLSSEAYILWVTVFIYMTTFAAIRISGRALGLDLRAAASAVIVVAFFPYFFSISAHIVRQVIAGSLGALAVGFYLKTGRHRYALYFAALMIHTSSAFLILLPLSALFAKKLRLSGPVSQFAIMAIVALAMYALLPLLASSLGIFSYGVGRLTQDSFFELNALPMSALLLALVFTVICLLASWLSPLPPVARARVSSVTSLMLFLMCIVFVAHQAGHTEIATRFLYYFYSMTGLIFLLAMSLLNRPELIGAPIIVIMTLIFPIQVEQSTWTYAPFADLLTQAPIQQLFGFVLG